MSRPPRLTVAIPLFKAELWKNNIIQNIQRIPDNAQIILSDNVSSDDTAHLIANHFAGDPRIRLRMRNGKPGWRQHVNDLISECNTELFCLLPQDDLITPHYYEKHLSELDQNPSAGIAFGVIIPVGEGHDGSPFPSPGFPLGQKEPWQEALLLEQNWNLGIPFRGVIRNTVLQPVPATPGDFFADQVWMFSMALTTHLICVDNARYIKRYHSKNTHGKWQVPSEEQRKSELEKEIRSVLGEDHEALSCIGKVPD